MSRILWLALSSLVAVLTAAALNMQSQSAIPESRRAADTVKAVVGRGLTGEAKIRRALESITEADFKNTTLTEVCHWFSEAHEIPIRFDEVALIEGRHTAEDFVTLRIGGLPLESILDLILQPLRLDYVIKDEALTITTRFQARKSFEERAYPVPDLVLGRFKPEELHDILRFAASPDERDENGEEASLRIEGGNLVVRHHRGAHRELVRTLEKLRAFISPRQPAPAAREREADASVADQESTWRALDSVKRKRRKRKAEPPSAEQMRRALRSPVEIDFVDVPLRDALIYLKDYHEIPIGMDERALIDDGIAPDTPVTLKVEGVSLEAALNILLTPLQSDYFIADEGLEITTMAETYGMFSTEFHSVRELREAAFGAEDLQEILRPCLDVAEPAWGSTCWGCGLNFLAVEVEQPALLVRGSLLVARATPRGHRQLAAALEKLRAAMRQ